MRVIHITIFVVVLVFLSFSNYVLATERNSCFVPESINEDVIACKYRYFTRNKTYLKEFCNVPQLIDIESEAYKTQNFYSFLIDGYMQSTFTVQVDIYDCEFSWSRPSTWFSCEERYSSTEYISVTPNINMNLYVDNRSVGLTGFDKSGYYFSMFAAFSNSLEDVRLNHFYKFYVDDYNIVESGNYDYVLNPSVVYDDISNESTVNSLKPFSFPFSKIIGVTQWHGYTAYDNPHTGIDFGAYKEQTLAVGSGTVVGKGWDSYYGGCISSGGNFLTILHDNGMHTVYFHLEEVYVDVGDRVTAGQVVARTGNSGSWNCQALGYHLHFETRENKSQSSHVNPVDYINADWNSISTLGYVTYPGRLSGDNPHPGS